MAKSKKAKLKQVSPQVLKRASKIVLSGKCPFSKPTYLKLKRHRNIIRKLAAMKGSVKSQKAFMKKNNKQIGGFLPFLPLIAKAIGALLQ